MTFPVPVFNLLASLWKFPRTPSSGLADVTNIPFALYCDPHSDQIYVPVAPFSATLSWSVLGKTPAGAHVYNRQDVIAPDKFDINDCYSIWYKQIFFKGFPQQFEGLLLIQCNLNGSVPRTY